MNIIKELQRIQYLIRECRSKDADFRLEKLKINIVGARMLRKQKIEDERETWRMLNSRKISVR